MMELRRRAAATFWRLADMRVPKELLLAVIGGLALLTYLFVLFFGTRPRK
jgi:hypothetical protein